MKLKAMQVQSDYTAAYDSQVKIMSKFKKTYRLKWSTYMLKNNRRKSIFLKAHEWLFN